MLAVQEPRGSGQVAGMGEERTSGGATTVRTGTTGPGAARVVVAEQVEHTRPVTGVVVGVDGSHSARAAVRWAAAEAARRGAELDLVQVLPPASRPGDDTGLPHGRARALLYRAAGAALAIAPTTRVSMAVAYDRVGPALVSYARDASLLVVGSNGPGGPIPLSVGRVLAEVTAHAECPVIIVPRTRAEPSATSSRPVFLAARDVTDDERALDFAAETAHRWAVPLVVLTGGTDRGRTGHGYSHGHSPGLTADDATRYRQRYPGLTIESRVAGRTDGPISWTRQGAQLIVTSSLQRGSAAGALSGWTRHFLPILSPCPVAVIRPGSAASRERKDVRSPS
jgi:nucleotide-binding universal stress UspA family protein